MKKLSLTEDEIELVIYALKLNISMLTPGSASLPSGKEFSRINHRVVLKLEDLLYKIRSK